MKPLNREDIFQMIGKVVYINNLEVISVPPSRSPAVVFGWGYKDPFAEDKSYIKDVVHEPVVVQPAAEPKYTGYWRIGDYGKTWEAYLSDIEK